MWLRTMRCLQSKFKPVTYFPLLTKHCPRCFKINNYTTHTYYTIILCRQKLSLTFLPFQSESTIPDQMQFFFFVLKVRNCHFISLIVLVPQQMLKWSKRVSLRSVSFTNYPTLHHPLSFHFFLLFFSCLQILHVTKYYNIPRIQNQIYTKFQLRKYTQKLYTVEYSQNIARCSIISLVINNSLVIKF